LTASSSVVGIMLNGISLGFLSGERGMKKTPKPERPEGQIY